MDEKKAVECFSRGFELGKMNYILEEVQKSDKELIYAIKKRSVYQYVSKIWGWDEEYQIIDFEASFIPSNFKKIMVEKVCAGFVETQVLDDAVNITEIHIIKDYQGLGMGSSIIKDIIAGAKDKSFAVTLGCFKENTGAKRLYERLGFIQTKETYTHFIFRID